MDDGHEPPAPQVPSVKCCSSKCCVRLVISFLFFGVILASSVTNKLSLVYITNYLSSHIQNKTNKSEDIYYDYDWEDSNQNDHHEAVAVYWQLLLILLVPNSITFLRCFFFGFLFRTRSWPKIASMFYVSINE